MKNAINFFLAAIFISVFSIIYVNMNDRISAIETQQEPQIWTKGFQTAEDLWCEVSSYAPDKHWCDYAQQRAEIELEQFCAEKENAIQCEGI